MALMTTTTPAPLTAAVTGTLTTTGTAVSSSDTISGNLVGGILEIRVGATPTNVTFVDPGRSAAGNTTTQAVAPVAASTNRAFRLTAAYVDSVTNLITVNFSSTTTVTYILYPPA